MPVDPTVASGFPVDNLRSYVQVFDAALSVPFCAQMIASFEQMKEHHVVRKPGWREGLNASAWTELDLSAFADDAFKGFFYKQIEDYLSIYNQRLGLTIPVPPSPLISQMRLKRYVVGTGEPPYWMYQHAGLPPLSNNKYFLSLYLLFPQTRLAAAP